MRKFYTIAGMKIFEILFSLLLLAAFLPPIKCKYSAEEVNLVYYDLSISPVPINADSLLEAASSQDSTGTKRDDPPSSSSASNAASSLTISNKYGQKYSCRVPTYVEPNLSDPPPSTKVTNEEIQAVLDPILDGRCLLSSRESGAWWTYEFCYKSSITQYHLANDDSIEGDVSYLGIYESDKNWMSLDAMTELNGKRKQTLHHSQTYTNGTLCDLTNRFRRAEVRFVCDENAVLANDAYLHSVDEPESCEYLLIVRTGALCRLPAFVPIDKKPPPVKIECRSILEAAEYHAYIEKKEVEEAKKREEAARKKQQEQLRRQLQTEMRYLETSMKDRQKLMNTLLKLDTFGNSDGTRDKAAPLLEIFGKSKADYLKMIDEKEENPEAPENAGSKYATNLGAAGTVEYEYMTHWLEQEVQNLESDEATMEASEQIHAVKGLSEDAKLYVNEFKRDTRRVSLSTTFKANLEALTDDMFDTVVWWDKNFEQLGKREQAQAAQEVKIALTKALTTLIDELEDTERAMEIAGRKTDLSGLIAFEEMREMIEARKNGGIPKDGGPLKPEVGATTTPMHATEKKHFEDLWKAMINEKKQTSNAESSKTASADVNNGKDTPNTKDGETADMASAEVSKPNSLRKEMESQLGSLMGDVERELKAEGVFDDLGDEAIAEVKTEALRSLAKSLTSLLEKLDDDEERNSVDQEEVKERRKSTKKSADNIIKSSAWRKLVQELAAPDSDGLKGQDEETEAETGTTTADKEGVKVRVSVIKAGDEAGANEVQSTKQSSKLERRIAKKLEEAGFDTQGRPVQVKIFTTVNVDENNAAADAGASNVHVLSEEEAEQFSNIVFNMFGGGGVERSAEQRRYQSLEDSYSFGATGENGDAGSSKKSSTTRSMNTVVAGGGR